MTATKIIVVLALLVTAATAVFANAPGGGYILCDSRNPSSPVRCTTSHRLTGNCESARPGNPNLRTVVLVIKLY